jgi:hypothetical protein
MIKEELIQFIWQHKVLKPLPFITVSGKEIKVLKPGEHNRNSGPDFFNARIELENIHLAGNVEVHVNTSDWLKHKHQNNSDYDNIILHVVYNHDTSLEQNTKFNVEVLELKNLISEDTLNRYKQLSGSKHAIACANQLQQTSDLHVSLWLDRVLIERLEDKEKQLYTMYKSFGANYTQTFFVLLLKAFGFKVNAAAFELLGKQIPVQLLLRHANDLKQCEALLLGAAGLLEEQFTDTYAIELQNEFEFLKQKYKLIPLDKKVMKYSRMRPSNFPDLRLAQFAALVHHHPGFLQSPQDYKTREEINKALSPQVSEYWQNHYRLGLIAKRRTGPLGQTSGELLLINTLVPFLFFYSKRQNHPELKERAISLLEGCTFENNHKTRLFSAKKAVLTSAAQSQGCIQLFDSYCSKKRCLNCGIAASLLKIGRMS